MKPFQEYVWITLSVCYYIVLATTKSFNIHAFFSGKCVFDQWFYEFPAYAAEWTCYFRTHLTIRWLFIPHATVSDSGFKICVLHDWFQIMYIEGLL